MIRQMFIHEYQLILCFLALFSQASKLMLKIFQVRLQQYVYHKLPDVQTGFRKGRRTRDQIANIYWIIENTREFQEISTSALLTMPKPLCGSQQTLENSERDGNIRSPDLPLEKSVCRSGNMTCMDMKKQTVSK